MCFLLFLESNRCFSHVGVSQFLQLSRHLSWSCASNFYKFLAIMSLSELFSISFGLPFFLLSTSQCGAFAGPLSLSFLSTCPSHRNLCSFRHSFNLSTSVISRIFSLFRFFLIVSIILISVVFNFLSSSTLDAQHLAP